MNCSPYLQADAARDRVQSRFPVGQRVMSIDSRTGEVRSVLIEGRNIWLEIALDNGGQVTELPGYWDRVML